MNMCVNSLSYGRVPTKHYINKLKNRQFKVELAFIDITYNIRVCHNYNKIISLLEQKNGTIGMNSFIKKTRAKITCIILLKEPFQLILKSLSIC